MIRLVQVILYPILEIQETRTQLEGKNSKVKISTVSPRSEINPLKSHEFCLCRLNFPFDAFSINLSVIKKITVCVG